MINDSVYKEVVTAINTLIEQSPKLLEEMKEQTLTQKEEWDIQTYKHEGEYEEIITYEGYDVDELLICIGEITLCTTNKELNLLETQYEVLGKDWHKLFQLAKKLIKNKPSNFIPTLLLLSDSFDDCLTNCSEWDLKQLKKQLEVNQQ